MGWNIGKNISNNLSSKYGMKFCDHANWSATDLHKSALKNQFKKQQKQLVILLVIKFLIKLRITHKIHHIIFQRQLTVKQKKPVERYISPEKRQITFDLRFI